MDWIRTTKGYLINPDTVESIGIGRKEKTYYYQKEGQQFPEIVYGYVYAVRIRTISGVTYDVSEHTMKEKAESIMEEIYKKLQEAKHEKV